MATITSFSPDPVDVGQNLVIDGTDLDTTSQVVFRSRGGSGVVTARPISTSATQVVVQVPLRSKSGNFFLVTGGSGNVLAPGMITINDPFAPPPSPAPGAGGAGGAGGGAPGAGGVGATAFRSHRLNSS